MIILIYVLQDYYVMSSYSNDIGYVIFGVEIFIPLVVGDFIYGSYTVLFPVRTLKKMYTYPLSGIVCVSIWLLLVVVGRQNVLIFPNWDLTSYFPSNTLWHCLLIIENDFPQWFCKSPFLSWYILHLALLLDLSYTVRIICRVSCISRSASSTVFLKFFCIQYKIWVVVIHGYCKQV